MTKQEVNQFSVLLRKAENEAVSSIEKLCTEYPSIIPFSLSEFSGPRTSFPRIESEGIYITYYWSGCNEEDIYDFPLSILTPEGLEEYAKNKIQEKKEEEAERALKQKREAEKFQKEFQEYLKLKEKFESEDEVKNAN